MIDYVHDTRVANQIATLNGRVTQRREKIPLSGSSRPNYHGAIVLLDEAAVEQPQDRDLGDSLGELEVVFSQSLGLGKLRFTHSPLESALLMRSLFHSDQ
jgi:hypothetical protein